MRIVLAISLLGLLGNVFAQDPQYSQFYANPLYLNPAFAGTSDNMRISLNSRWQWPKIPGGFNTHMFSADFNIQEKGLGFGTYFIDDEAGSGGLTYRAAYAIANYKLPIARGHNLNVAIKAGLASRFYDLNQLLFSDQIARGDVPGTVDPDVNDARVNYPDLGIGFLYHHPRVWAGVSIDHMNNPNYTFIEETELPTKISTHLGYRLPLEQTRRRRTVLRSVMLAFHYKTQLEWDQMDIGFYYQHYDFIVGLWYRGMPGIKSYLPGYSNHDAVILMVGARKDGWSFGYSYDLTISKIFGDTGGSHEISIARTIKVKRKVKRKIRMLPCPTF